MTAVIELEDVEKVYQMGETEVRALRGSDLEIEEGEFIAVMGPSGSGKSTLMNMMGALDVPTNGLVEVADRDLSEMGPDELALLRNKKVGFIFQEFNLLKNMNTIQNVMLPLTIQEVPRSERRSRASELLEKVGLGDRLEHMPSELSGGQRQRVSIARALANNPEIVLADEPTGNLDTETGAKIMDLLTEFNNEGKTIIMVTHDPNDAEYADRTIKIKDGVTHPGEEDE
ncbi:MAG: ABC-type antimicrobial peptide transport system, ATPase component [Candidatus Nanosalina sp. J07AB43]|jgi:ABC-type antimicrobial peptide transport system, ATPase component|nr:MAG: ABC-type antimicrobial peptide transport system, ATPase component [Candidatus Nanosalina sp. J07AB43]